MAEDSGKDISLAVYEFKRALKDLEKYSGRATELISLYIPPGKQISDVVAYLRDEYSQSSNIKSKSTMKNVTSAIESIMSRLKAFKKPPENGVVFFVGHVAKGANQTEMIARILEPPEPITTFLYRCDSKFYLEPLKDMITDKSSYGLIVIDRSEASIGMLKGKRIIVIKHIESRVPSKHHQGGQSSLRFERLIEIAAHEYFTKVGEIASAAFLAEPELEGVLIGGPGSTKEFFAKKDYLHYEIKKKIIDLFDTGYTNEYGLKELVEKAQDVLSDLDVIKEKKAVERLMKEIKKPDGGLAVYGMTDVIKAVQLGAVDLLLISEGIDKNWVSFVCNSCGYRGEGIEKDGMKCPKCGSTNIEIKEREDIVEYFYGLAEQMGTKVMLISRESEEGELLYRAFGGIAGILRFRVN